MGILENAKKSGLSHANDAVPVRVQDTVEGDAGARIRWIEINRPERANALDAAAFVAMREELLLAATSEVVDAVILTSNGTRYFCAGGDRAAAVGADMPEGYSVLMHGLMEAMLTFQKPLVGAVGGAAIGGGAMLVLAMHQVVMTEAAYLQSPELRHGLVPAAQFSMYEALCGAALAREMVISGKRLTAPRCLTLSLANELAPASDLRQRAVDHALALLAIDKAAYAVQAALAGSVLLPAIRALRLELQTILPVT
ncbi:enoyl-CoA hydratase/isomerase family protein [Sphingobium fuliginis]|uniref:enoyl-CoA hydratase/isomerase family protein n=1 Tax=Sphingobium fuliginis (strain ATCC 27551) TaxID=336203 RepID=UPI000C06B8B1|nr:enoyl-CoA hydratase/isomerase family protein [Sphingobium fuliginis]